MLFSIGSCIFLKNYNHFFFKFWLKRVVYRNRMYDNGLLFLDRVVSVAERIVADGAYYWLHATTTTTSASMFFGFLFFSWMLLLLLLFILSLPL